MPTESRMTQVFLKQFRHQFPQAVVFKNNDRTTGGIPDASITLGHTVWVEFKRDKPSLTDLQRITLGRLDKASGGRAVVLVFVTATKSIDIYDYRGWLVSGLDQAGAIAYLVGLAEYGR